MENDDMNEKQVKLTQQAQVAFRSEVARIRSFADLYPDHDFAKVNQHLLDDCDQVGSYHCVGLIELAGVVYWALSLQLDFAYPDVRIFAAKGGPTWSIAAFVGDVAGSFTVPADEISGRYRFNLNYGGFEVGAATVNFYEMDGRFVGSVYGVVGGAGVSVINDKGTFSTP